nr:hypothetical protein CFP56_00580 [Quercus suber]
MPHAKERIENRGHPLIACKQDAAGEHGPAEPHGGALPEPGDAVIGHDAAECLDRARAAGALAARLDGIERLRGQGGDDAGDTAVGEVGQRRLGDVVLALVVLEDVVRAHAEGGRAGLLERRAGESAVQAQEAVLLHHRSDAMRHAAVALLIARVVDQRRLDALRRRHGKDRCHHAAEHARREAAQRRQGPRLRVLERVLDRVEGQEADPIFAHRPDHQRRAAFVQRGKPFRPVDVGDDFEGVLGHRLAFLLPELHARFCKFERILFVVLDLVGMRILMAPVCYRGEALNRACRASGKERYYRRCRWILVFSIVPISCCVKCCSPLAARSEAPNRPTPASGCVDFRIKQCRAHDYNLKNRGFYSDLKDISTRYMNRPFYAIGTWFYSVDIGR